MNRNNLFELMATIAAAAALCGCASAPPPQHIAQPESQIASAQLGAPAIGWVECIRAAIPRFDDPQSPSEVVARAAMKSCSDQYTSMMQVEERNLAPACSQDPACTRGALARAQSEASKTATDEVVTARVKVAGAQVLKCE